MIIVRGPLFPYLGSETKDKSSQSKWIKTEEVPSNLKGPIKIQGLVGWAIENNSNLSELVSNILRAQSNIDPSIFHSSDGSIQGCADHRYKSEIHQKGSYTNLSTTVLSWWMIDLNSTQSFSQGGVNYNLFFQDLISTSLSFGSANYLTTSGNSTFHFHFNCRSCVWAIDESFMGVETPPTRSLTPVLHKNLYFFIDHERTTISTIPIIRFTSFTIKPHVLTSHEILNTSLRAGLTVFRQGLSVLKTHDVFYEMSKGGGPYSLAGDPIMLLVGPIIQQIGLSFVILSQNHSEVEMSELFSKAKYLLNMSGENYSLAFSKLILHPETREYLERFFQHPINQTTIPLSRGNTTTILTDLILQIFKMLMEKNPLYDMIQKITRGFTEIIRESETISSYYEWKSELYFLIGLRVIENPTMPSSSLGRGIKFVSNMYEYESGKCLLNCSVPISGVLTSS